MEYNEGEFTVTGPVTASQPAIEKPNNTEQQMIPLHSELLRRCACLFGLTLLITACAQAPTSEFRAYSEVADEVGQTTLTLLEDYQAAAPSRDNIEPSTPFPATFDPRSFDPETNADVAARRHAVEAIQTYNATMLFLAEGGSYEMVKSYAKSLSGLLGLSFPGAASTLVVPLAEKLERARSAREFREALAATRLPGEDCDATEIKTGTDKRNPTEELKQPTAASACRTVIDGIYAIFREDTASYYARQVGLVNRRSTKLRREFGDLYKSVVGHAAKFSRPQGGTGLERLIQVESRIKEAALTINPGAAAILVKLGATNASRAMDDAALTTMEKQAEQIASLADTRTKLVNALNAYHGELGRYVQTISTARRYLDKVEEAAMKPADNFGQAREIVTLGMQVRSQAITGRQAFDKLSSILLGRE